MTTVGECWDKYLKEHIPTTINKDRNIRYWKYLQWFADKDAALSPMEVEQYVKMRALKPGAINRELNMLNACLKYAERHGLIPRAPHIKQEAKPPPRMRALSREECGMMVSAADRSGDWRQRVFIRLALATGQRPGAICDLEWSRVSLANKVIDFRLPTKEYAKMKKRSVVPMNDMALEAVGMANMKRNGQYVLHWTDGSMIKDAGYELVRSMAIRAKLKDVSPHVLRHSVASILLQDGHDLLAVSRLLGHSNSRITEQVYFQHPPSWLKKSTDTLVF